MILNKDQLLFMVNQIEELLDSGQKFNERFESEIKRVHPAYQKSILNFLQYLAIRTHNIHDLQSNLGKLAFSRLGKAESHVIESLLAIKNNLQVITSEKKPSPDDLNIDFEIGKQLLNTHACELLGNQPANRRVRIMVTIPSEGAHNYELIKDLLINGMNCARINCAHDDADAWLSMINHIHQAKKETGLNCKICMDLAGPKLRTGHLVEGPKVIHLSPPRDPLGRVLGAYRLWLAPELIQTDEDHAAHIPVEEHFVQMAEKGDEIQFEDTRGKKRSLLVKDRNSQGLWAESDDGAYLMTGTVFTLIRNEKVIAETQVGELPPIEQKLLLRVGDTFILHKDEHPGEPAIFDDDGNIIKPAHVSVPLPNLYEDLKPGEPILFDDGKIEGTIESVTSAEIKVKITFAKPDGSKLKAEKGINLPISDLSISGLTKKDKKDLKFVAKHADVINMSFVNTAKDVDELLDLLKVLDAPENIGIILKIETQKAVINLPEILITAMKHYPVGVMIARGDLAVECGWRHLAEVQEEILRICEAAHVPNVWATQVLENVAKTGRPSRAEITDAAMAQRAECVMLNKGPFILEAISILEDILQSMQFHQEKKAPMLPKLKFPENFNLSS